MKLNISEEVIEKEKDIMVDLKFGFEKQGFLYPSSYDKIAQNYVKAFEYLVYLNKSTSIKIGEFLDYYQNVYLEIKEIVSDDSELDLKKTRLRKKLKRIINENYSHINEVISKVYPLGKNLELYNVEKNVGFSS